MRPKSNVTCIVIKAHQYPPGCKDPSEVVGLLGSKAKEWLADATHDAEICSQIDEILDQWRNDENRTRNR